MLGRLREDTAYTFRTRAEIIERSKAAIARAEAVLPQWFGRLPRAQLRIEEYPEFKQRAGAAAGYTPAASDGSRPGTFFIATYQPARIPRATAEYIAFHEAIPGHHLQTSIAQEQKDAHPITRYFLFLGFAEGWGLYSERLADEMGLYTSDLDRLGMLSGQAWRAARLMIDVGIHARGWTRRQAVDFLIAHSMNAPAVVQGEIDRYITYPGQATAYMVGELAILDLRREAQHRLGGQFDVRAFHDLVLGSGNLTLPMLREEVERWLHRKP